MTLSAYDLLQQYRKEAGLVAEAPAPTSVVEPERAFVVETGGRTIFTAPLREVASSNPDFLYLHGRLVGADTPNRNKAMWTTADLEMAEPSVAGGPLNWLHDDQRIIGCLMDGHLVSGREAADEGVGNHIVSRAAAWGFLFPNEVATIQKAAAQGELYYSMECLSKSVMCTDSPSAPGCGREVSYADYDSRTAPSLCQHLRERSSVRRYVEPWFLGAAVIVPPVQPGWANANAGVLQEAAQLRETAGLADGGLSSAEALDLATAVLSWSSRTAPAA